MKKNKKIITPIILIILFAINSLLVILHKTEGIDDFVHSLVLKSYSEVTTKVMKIFTFMGSTIFIVALCAILFITFLVLKKKITAFKCLGNLVLSTALNNVIKLIIRRPRPVYMTVVENTFSYPSGHMMASTTLYGFLIILVLNSNISKLYKTIYTSLLTILILLVGISRIYLGAHYFSDVFGGALLSTALLIIVELFLKKKNIIQK